MSSFNNPYQSPHDPTGGGQYMPGPRRQSTWGKVALIIGLVSWGLDACVFLFGAVADGSDIGGDAGEVFALGAGLVCCGSFVANIVGIVFAIIGLVERDRGRAFAVAGLILNIVPLLIILGTMVFGLFMFNEAMGDL